MTSTIVPLARSDFNGERLRVTHGPLSAHSFSFSSGVAAVRLTSDAGELVMLPFQGQQIWSATLRGRALGMESVCDEPQANVPFLQTFGGFMQHCGMLAMGGPSANDRHALHGEMPNAPFQKAWILCGRDDRGEYIGVGGSYHHAEVFGGNYVAEPTVKLYAGSSVFDVHLEVTNLGNVPMDLMYLAHINFRIRGEGTLCYSAPATPEHVRVRTLVPAHIAVNPEHAAMLRELKDHPEKHHHITSQLSADPEIVLYMDYLSDHQGWAHSLYVHESGDADYVSHRPGQLPRATRWISRTPDHNALAIVEPGTAEPDGYTAEKKKGNVQQLAAKQKFVADLRIGTLNPQETRSVEEIIKTILKGQ